MKKTLLRNIKFSVIAVVVLAVVLVGVSRVARVQAAQNLTVIGYAWSQYLGAINFDGSNYGVQEDNSNGKLSDYAWAPNIGWINFGVSDATHPAAVVETNGDVTGYARACSSLANPAQCNNASATLDPNSGGWDGWISFAGTASDGSTYAVTQDSSCDWTGYAWGSDGIGAINMQGTASDGTSYGVSVTDPSLTATFSATPTTITAGETSTLNWSSNNTVSCTIDNGVETGGATSGSKSVTPVTTTTYTLTCLSSKVLRGGCVPSIKKTATVTVTGSTFSCTQTNSNFTATPGGDPYQWTIDGVVSSNNTDTVPVPTTPGAHSAVVTNTGGNTAYCNSVGIVAGSSNSCVANTTGTITASPNRVKSNSDPVTIAWSVQGYNTLDEFKAANCEIDKDGTQLEQLTDASVDSCNASGTYTDTGGVSHQTVYSVRCGGGSSLAWVVVNIAPKFKEF